MSDPDEAGIGPVVWGSAGDMADKIYIPDRHGFIIQEGQAVFRWATTALHPVAKKACERAGVDPAEAAEVRGATERCQLAVLLVEHDLSMVGSVVDRTIVMNLGMVIAEGTFDEVMADPVVRQAYLGVSA